MYFRAQKLCSNNRATLNAVFDERGNGARLFLSFFFPFFLRSLFEVVGKFDALMSPFGNRTYDPEILLRAFRGYLEGYGNEGDYESGETETRRKIFKFLCVLSM